MKIKILSRYDKIGTIYDSDQTEIDAGSNEVIVEGCYTGIGMKTDQGLFGIAMRDDGIEVMLNGKLVWSSMDLNPPPTGEKED